MQAEDLDVLIVGAGVSGVGMGSALKSRCPDKQLVILERRHAVGGTWDLFRYPGVRSDSDMHTYGYAQRPWDETKVLADGATILQYLTDTARAHGLDTHLRHGMKIVEAAWSSAQQRWTLLAMGEHNGTRHHFRCRMLVMGTGYYDHDAGHTPDFPGLERFSGTVVHPQHWPPALDCHGQRVVVVGSGATAVTLVPALAESAAHVTMLQRSPSYYFSVPSRDGLTQALLHLLPRRRAFAFARWRNRVLALGLYAAARRWPQAMRRFLLAGVRRQLRGATDMRHFTPAYEPWDQRLCIVPDADLFVAIRDGKASVDRRNRWFRRAQCAVALGSQAEGRHPGHRHRPADSALRRYAHHDRRPALSAAAALDLQGRIARGAAQLRLDRRLHERVVDIEGRPGVRLPVPADPASRRARPGRGRRTRRRRLHARRIGDG
jgi:monooxygenase